VAALSLLLGTSGAAVASTRAHPHAGKAERKRQAAARERRRLAALVRRDPRAVLRPSFIKRAQLVDFTLPVWVRLNPATDNAGHFAAPDDSLQISWDTSTQAWPLGAGFLPEPPVTTSLDGGFTMQVHFGNDTSGYGGFGALELTTGQAASLSATPFDISDFDPTCASGPALRVATGSTVRFTGAGSTWGILNLATGTAAGVLHLFGDLAAERADACGGPYLPTGEAASTVSPIVLSFTGGFRISPTLTADGRLRLGKLTVDDAVLAQQSSFSYVHACTSTTVGQCDDRAFPSRTKVLKLTAELLIGGP
jgi:hypothetical protein